MYMDIYLNMCACVHMGAVISVCLKLMAKTCWGFFLFFLFVFNLLFSLWSVPADKHNKYHSLNRVKQLENFNKYYSMFLIVNCK